MADTGEATYTYGTAYLTRWDAELPIAREGNTQWMPVRALCTILGIDSGGQLAVLRADSRYRDALREAAIPTAKGWHTAIWIRRAEAALWLAGIDPARVKITARGPLADFQVELMAEADRLLFGAAPRAGEAERGRVDVIMDARPGVYRVYCEDCGAPHIIVVEDGKPRVERERANV